MARTIGTFTAHTEGSSAITGEVKIWFCIFFVIRIFFLLFKMYSPPKYEEAIKSNYQEQEIYSPPPYTPLLHSTM
jgi:hypothetical protein